MERFLADLFADEVTPERRIAVFTTPDRQTRFFCDLGQLGLYARQRSPAQNVYFGVGLIRGDPAGRGKHEDIAAIGALWCDVDVHSPAHPRENLPQSLEEARGLLRQMPLPPSVVVASGHGLHAYWLLHEPWIFDRDEDRTLAASLARRWHGLVCTLATQKGWSLENLGDLTRVLRLPGTLNHNASGNPVPVRILESHPLRRYTPDDFEPFLPSEPQAAPAETAPIGPLVLRPDAEPPAVKLLETASQSPLFWATWKRDRPDLADQSQSGYDLSLATIAVLSGWSDQEVADLIIAARRHHGQKPEKALREDYIRRTLAKARQASAPESSDVDLSKILGPDDACMEPEAEPGLEDPGTIPADMLRVPGFVSEVMDLCLASAPYPNQAMTFCGALSLQALLAGRKVRDPGDNRTNIYLLGLALSSGGKDWIRKLNAKILHHIGMASCLGDRLASGEGIQDALFVHPSMLFQTDEIDGILQTINKAKDARHEGIMTTLLSLYSSSNSLFAMRPKAGKPNPGVIDQPNLVLFGTAIPNHYYEALSERMLTNGFFARMIIVEAAKRNEGQEPDIIRASERVLTTAKWWADFRPGSGNLENWHPEPAIVEHTPKAKELLIATRQEADAEYTQAEALSDPVGTTVWGRVSEHTRKLALIYAVSENHRSPRIDAPAVEWASQFVMHQTRRMLFMAAMHVAENPFHAECLKLLRKLRESGGQMARRQLMRVMRCKALDFDQIISTLVQQGDIVPVEIPTKTRPAQGYQIA